MKRLPFHKYQSIGNTFVLIESQEGNLSEMAQKMCHTKFGIGADGFLVVNLKSNPISMRMFNSDGSEDFCGNGLRCTAYHARYRGKEPSSILHGGREVAIRFDKFDWIDVTLPPYSFAPKDVPLKDGEEEIFQKEIIVANRKMMISAVSTGSTHTVIFQEPSEEDFHEVSPIIEHMDIFPTRTSVIWAWETGDKQLSIRIWERGVGETLGCGTGTAAVAACWFITHKDAMAISVKNPGGESVASRGQGGSVVISAKAQKLFSGEYLQTEQFSPPLVQLLP